MKPSVLVIDDDPFTREALAAILVRAGYQVDSLAGAGWEGEAESFSQLYQVAVVDFHLPTVNGLELARRLKACQPECRIIMISSELPRLPESAASVVVDRFLAKPFSKDVILEAIALLCPPQAP
ncbi:MAG: response regulator [Deltaproteobacteria bacterium]|nr:response regulator [Deltaproteobacteria bacterium]